MLVLNTSIERPIFIFGCSNSGTTILWEALKQHEELSGPVIEGQDLDGMPTIMTHFLGKDTFRLWAHPQFIDSTTRNHGAKIPESQLAYYLTERDYRESDKKQLVAVYERSLIPGTRLVTKSPADTLRARLIQSYFPDAYFIAIVRNGYAVTEGIRRKRLFDPERPQYASLQTRIDEAAMQWLGANRVALSHIDFLHRYKTIRYEDLVTNPTAILHEVLDFLEPISHQFPIPKFETHRNNEQIARLTEQELGIVTRICGEMLNHFGYESLSQK